MKIKFFFLLNLFLASASFAQYPAGDTMKTSDPNAMSRIVLLLNDGAIKNQEFIKRESQSISLEDRQILYRSQEKNSSGMYMGINTLIGLGIGSFIQGDAGGGVAMLIADISAASVTATAISNGNASFVWVGFGLYAFGMVEGLVFPVLYTHRYNNALKSSLRLDEPASISMRPLILDNGAVGMSVALNY